MKILIINGYFTNAKGMESFSEFQWAIKKALNLQKELVDTQTEYYIRDRENIDDFLYELDSSYVKKEAAKLFDHLDIIFIAGDPFLLPWAPSAKKIMVLLRMCIRVKKNVFLSSFAMQALVFLCSTNFEKNVHIINGKGKGGKIGEIVDLERPLAKLRNIDYFLDNLTGDLYSYNYDSNEWVTKANVGIHYEKTAQEYHSLGKYIIKAPIYRPKNLNDDKNVFTTRKTESVCFIKKNYCNHWLFDSIEKEFLICSKSPWNIHTFNFVNKEKTFVILAENQKGPVIIEMKNCIAVLFEISNKYYNTITILHNYIQNTIKMIKTQSKENYHNIEKYYSTKENLDVLFQHKRNNPTKGNRSIYFNVVSKNFNDSHNSEYKDLLDENEFKHVGFSASKSRIPAIFKKNMIREKILQNEPRKGRYKSDTDKEFFSMISVREKITPDSIRETNLHSQKKATKIFDKITPPDSKREKENEVIEEKMTKNKIRQILHPHISSDALPKNDRLWVPGNLNESRKQIFRQRKSENKSNENTENNFIKIQSFEQQNHIRSYSNSFAKKDKNKTATQKFAPLGNFELLNMTPSYHFSSYKYREENNEKWLAGAFKT